MAPNPFLNFTASMTKADFDFDVFLLNVCFILLLHVVILKVYIILLELFKARSYIIYHSATYFLLKIKF